MQRDIVCVCERERLQMQEIKIGKNIARDRDRVISREKKKKWNSPYIFKPSQGTYWLAGGNNIFWTAEGSFIFFSKWLRENKNCRPTISTSKNCKRNNKLIELNVECWRWHAPHHQNHNRRNLHCTLHRSLCVGPLQLAGVNFTLAVKILLKFGSLGGKM